MRFQFSLKTIFLFTAVASVVAAICAAFPVFELRDLGGLIKSLWARRPTLGETAVRLAWSEPLVLGLWSIRHWTLTLRR